MRTIAQVAELLGVSRALIRKLIANRQLEFVKIGRCVRIPDRVIGELVSAGTVRAAPARRTAAVLERES